VSSNVQFRVSQEAALLEQFGDYLETGVLTLDPDLIVRGWNRWLEAASNIPQDEIVGHSLFEFFPDLQGSPAEAALQAGLSGTTYILAQRFHGFLLPLPPSPGFTRYARMQQSARIMPLEQDGAIVGVIALIQDVTERVSKEAELREARDLAEQASRAKSDFIAAMSHELRTPLTAIIGFSDLMEAQVGGELAETHKLHTKRIKAGAWHLIGIIDEILTYARMEAGRLDLMLDRTEVISLAAETAAFLEPAASAKGLELRTIVPEGKLFMEIDALRLRQVLINLVGNAIKFTETGHIDLEVNCTGNRINFIVRDTGPGIPPGQQTKIFEPFRQLEQGKSRQKGGSGLGLAVSRDLARLMNGDLIIESSADSGTAFVLWLPIGSTG
jgi:signal transduction histidine kinase